MKPLGTDVLNLNLHPCCQTSLLYIKGFDIKVTHRRIQSMRSHASHSHHCHCHYCNVDLCCSIMSHAPLFLYLSCIHVNIACLFNILSTLVDTCMIIGGLECMLNVIFLLHTKHKTIMISSVPLCYTKRCNVNNYHMKSYVCWQIVSYWQIAYVTLWNL